MNKLSILLTVILFLICYNEKVNAQAYKNAELDIETRVADLVQRMTIEEKVMQLDMYSAGDLVFDGRLFLKTDKKKWSPVFMEK